MSAELAGHTVIVTRPAQQSGGTVAGLRALGAKVVEFPAIRIEPVETNASRAEVVPDDFDWLVYTSANAALFAARAYADTDAGTVAALGQARAGTRRAGNRAQHKTQRGANSESLLALPESRPRWSARAEPAGHRGRAYLRPSSSAAAHGAGS